MLTDRKTHDRPEPRTPLAESAHPAGGADPITLDLTRLPQLIQLPVLVAVPEPRRAPLGSGDVHPGAIALVAGAFAWALGCFALAFWAKAEALFMVAISAAYTLMFFAVPWICHRMARHNGLAARHDDRPDRRFADFVHGQVETFTGPLRGRDALVQICGIPVAIAVASTAICLVRAIVV